VNNDVNKEAAFHLTVLKTILLLFIYTVVCFGVPALVNIGISENFSLHVSVWIDTCSQIIINVLFFIALANATQYKIPFLNNVKIVNVLFALVCPLLLFLLLDNFFDPIFNKLFPVSENQYQEMLDTMRLTPAATFVQACLVAPFTEEMLMRGYILEGLKNKYGALIAVALSTALFAILHINIGQILSALIGGLIIAALYLKTKSASCCILTHILYNTVAYFTTII
jgi:membrane protease YdiL (CAAX protease family)